MTSRKTLRLVILMTAFWSVFGFSRHSQLLNNEIIQTLRTMRRAGSQCISAGFRCFSSAQCCDGFVCAAFDDFSGENPDVPGFCVKEKDLQVCVKNEDCDGLRSTCVPFSRTAQGYCITESLRNEINPLSSLPSTRKFNYANFASSGRLGSVCQDSSDCDSAGSHRLCCKDVRRARQGVKRMCDKIETPWPCI